MSIVERRSFCGALAAGALYALAAAPGGAQTPSVVSEADFTRDADARRSRHRQAFAARRISNGDIFGFMVNSLNAYQFGWREGAGTLHAAGVLYALASALGLDDEAWDTYRLRELVASQGDGLTQPLWPSGNPFLRPKTSLSANDGPDDYDGFYHDRSIVALQHRGASFYVCDNALRLIAVLSAGRQTTGERDVDALHAALRSRVVPGATIVPAGVAVVNALQEQQYTLFQAS